MLPLQFLFGSTVSLHSYKSLLNESLLFTLSFVCLGPHIYHVKVSQTARIQTRDLGQQLEAADKQLKATRQFLEEQAQEREAEREEWERRVLALQQQPARSGHLKRDSNLLINSYFRNILTSLRAEVLYNGMHACKDHLQSHALKCFSDYLNE